VGTPGPREPLPARRPADLASNPGVITSTLLSGVIAVAVAAAEWTGSGKALTSPTGILWGLVALLGVVAMLLGFGLELRRRRQEPAPPHRSQLATLPTGTVSFLFTDIEGSTRLLQELGDRYAAVRDQHAAIVRQAIDEGGGVEVSTEGDSFFAAFGSPVGRSWPRSPPSVAWPATTGQRGSPCGSGWACTPERGFGAGTTMSAST
jgi:hypothetical protein